MIARESTITDFSYPVDETLEAIQRKDVAGVIGCIQVHLMRIIATSPLIFDVQQNVTNRVLSALQSESIEINTTQERTLRELLQTVYRGMRGGTFHGVNLRNDAIQRLSREGSLWLQKILIGETEPAISNGEIIIPPLINHNIPNWRAQAEAPPPAPPVEEEVVSAEIPPPASSVPIQKETAKTTKPPKPRRSTRRLPKEKLVPYDENDREKDDEEEIGGWDDELENDEWAENINNAPLDEDDPDEDNSQSRKLIDLSDGMSSLMRKTLNHEILSDEEVNRLAEIIQEAAAKCNQVLLTEELLADMLDLLQYTPPKIPKKISIPSTRRSVLRLEAGQTLTWDLLVSIRKITSAFLEWTKRLQKELADTILSQINGEITPLAQEAINKIVIHNQKLVFSIAKEFTNRGLALWDLHQEGNIWLTRAAKWFDPDRGNKFSTYATWWIEQTIRRAIANQGKTIRLPVHQHERNTRLSRVITHMLNELWRAPTNEEIAEELGIPLKKIVEWRQTMQQTLSLDTPLSDESGSSSFWDTIGDERTPRSDQGANNADMRSMAADFVEGLPKQEQDVIIQVFNLNGLGFRTLEEVGRQYGVTRERIRQIKERALKRMRKRYPHLNPFIEKPPEAPAIALLASSTFSVDELLGHISKLSPVEQRILKAWHWLEQPRNTTEEIKRAESISEYMVYTLRDNALKKLPAKVRRALGQMRR